MGQGKTSILGCTIFGAALMFAPVSCSGDSGFQGSGANDGSKNRSAGANGKERNASGDDNPGSSDGGDGHPGGHSGPGSDGQGRGGSDTNGTGFDKRENLPDGTVQLTKMGESNKGVLPVDIVFALDTSGSMNTEKEALQQKMPEFIKKLEAAGKDLDYRVWMIAQGFTFPTTDASKIEIVNTRVNSTDALLRLKEFVTGSSIVGLQGKTKLRATSIKHFVVITDDNATGVVATDFITLAATNPLLQDRTSFNGVIGFVQGQSATNKDCNIANVGEQYQILAGEKPLPSGQKSPLKGLIQDLCAADWTTKLVDTLAAKVIKESLRLEFSLPMDAKGASQMTVKIAGKDLPATAYTYDAARNTIIFSNATAPKPGEELVVRYHPKAV